MRKLILSLVAAIAALAVAGPASAATKVISIYGSGFSPKSTTITEGDTVTWKNRDNANHQVLADKGQFVSPIIRPNQTYSFTFRAVGHLHLQGRAASEADRQARRQGAAADADAACLGADRHVRARR